METISGGRESPWPIIAYKIFDVHRDGTLVLPKTLFHGHHGSRVLSLDEWLEAEERGIFTNKTPYTSGFHAFLYFNDAKAWAQRTRSAVERAGCWVILRGIELKPGAVQRVVLARRLHIPSQNWERRTSVTRIRDAD